jgi:hypothetical protein
MLLQQLIVRVRQGRAPELVSTVALSTVETKQHWSRARPAGRLVNVGHSFLKLHSSFIPFRHGIDGGGGSEYPDSTPRAL